MTWMGLRGKINPIEWCWRLVDNKLVPMMSDKKAAPDTPLKWCIAIVQQVAMAPVVVAENTGFPAPRRVAHAN